MRDVPGRVCGKYLRCRLALSIRAITIAVAIAIARPSHGLTELRRKRYAVRPAHRGCSQMGGSLSRSFCGCSGGCHPPDPPLLAR
eukprot:4547642-Alexandrium_andersonii.AAC.1